jgi:LysM repeat protein
MRQRIPFFALLAVLLLPACTLTNRPPTPTPQPTPIPLVLPTTPPLAVGADPATRLNNSTCPFTPANWIPYTVQPGDSLGALSVSVDTPMQELVTNNCLDNANSIFVEQIIYLPRQP